MPISENFISTTLPIGPALKSMSLSAARLAAPAMREAGCRRW
jgi:hypothetical protein